MDEAKRRAAIVGNLARLKSTWGKVQESIAQEREEAERKIREAEEAKVKRREIVTAAVARVMNECGPGFKFVNAVGSGALVRILYEPTCDERWVTEQRQDGHFGISVMRTDRQCFSHDTAYLSLYTEEAVMGLCLELLMNANRKHVPKQPGRSDLVGA